MSKRYRIPAWAYAGGIITLFIVQVALLYVMGHPLVCTCDYVKLWHGVVISSENSQHISDWYSFSHIIHGFIFYWILWLLFPKAPLLLRLFAAVSFAASWEALENSDFIISRYREATISLDYYGDSIINSVMDTVFMVVGFVTARKLPFLVTIGLALAMEMVVGYIIRDNLTLNVIMLLHPFQFILSWQAGA